jgi:hypothetical protein
LTPELTLLNVDRMLAFRRYSGGPGDRPSEKHRQIDRVLSIQIPHGVEFVAELGHSITGPLDKWANKPTTTARAATLPKIATLAP